jgi:hypothetical protein
VADDLALGPAAAKVALLADVSLLGQVDEPDTLILRN